MTSFKTCLAVSALMLGATAYQPALAQEMDRTAVENIIKEYLVSNPEVVEAALLELEKRRIAKEEDEKRLALEEVADILYDSPNQVVLGNPEGDVTLVEFFDYNCGYCRRSLADMLRLAEADKNLRIVLKEFPVLGQPSMEAAQVAIAVNDVAPELYQDFHVALMSAKGRANKQSALKAAKDLGIDQDKLQEALASSAIRDTLSEVFTIAEKLSLTGTPSYVVGGKDLTSDVSIGAVGFDRLSEQINAARASK
ncbi:DsbA family protein [Polycladidibacter hongkongensis]|uniref:DsbA family protein n=1 Tax=Polycladidibacter hongkongensis TaxID=1647556 RepID=UPI000ACC98E5|nr:DsbA family protein [Pseudovibrio hongkongensis]